MNGENSRWKKIADDVAAALGARPRSDRELLARLDAVQGQDLSEEEVEGMLEKIRSGGSGCSGEKRPRVVDWAAGRPGSIGNLALALFRDEGDRDPEVDALVEELRREALEGEDEGKTKLDPNPDTEEKRD